MLTFQSRDLSTAPSLLRGLEPFTFHQDDVWEDVFAHNPELIAFKRTDGTWANVYTREATGVVVMIFGRIGFDEGLDLLPDWIVQGNG